MESTNARAGVTAGQFEVHSVAVLAAVSRHVTESVAVVANGAFATTVGSGRQEDGLVSLGDGIVRLRDGGCCARDESHCHRSGDESFLKNYLDDISTPKT